jgi:hypothetical protein
VGDVNGGVNGGINVDAPWRMSLQLAFAVGVAVLAWDVELEQKSPEV